MFCTIRPVQSNSKTRPRNQGFLLGCRCGDQQVPLAASLGKWVVLIIIFPGGMAAGLERYIDKRFYRDYRANRPECYLGQRPVTRDRHPGMHVFILNVNFVVVGTLAKTLDAKINAILSRQRLAVQNLILLYLCQFLIWRGIDSKLERKWYGEACIGRLFVQHQEVMIVNAAVYGTRPGVLKAMLNDHYRLTSNKP